LRNPNVEIAMAAAMNFSPAAPIQRPVASAAGVVVAARPSRPSVRRYATLTSK
jgi:hypothetical protein